MKTLTLNVKKEPFEVMVTGEKTKEYRKPTKWIMSRLVGKHYDRIKIVSGYGGDKPYFIADFKGWWGSKTSFVKEYSNRLKVQIDPFDIIIDLGDILERGNMPEQKVTEAE